MERTIGLLTLYTVARSVYTLAIKRGQVGRNELHQHMLFTCLVSFGQALLIFALPPYTQIAFAWERALLPALFGTFYAVFMIFTVMAMAAGPVSLTTIISSFTSLFPVLAGVVLWNDRLAWTQIAGLVLFGAALFLFNSGSYTEADAKKPITLRWVMLALLALVCGGCAVTCTRRYCDLFSGYIKEYLFIANVTATLLTLPFVLHALRRPGTLTLTKRGAAYTFAASFAVDISNIIFMFYASAFSAAFYFPLTSVLGVVAVVFTTRVFLRERVSRRALCGIGVATVALALLALS